MWNVLILFLWLRVDCSTSIVDQSMLKLRSEDTVINPREMPLNEFVIRSPAEEKTDGIPLVNDWQDCVLANAIVTNYLTCLMVIASRQDFPFITPSSYNVKYIQNPNSFRQTITQLFNEIRTVLLSAHENLNHVQIGMGRIPNHLKTMLLLVKQAPLDSLTLLLPNSFADIDKLVNESLVILTNPTVQIDQVHDLITEIGFLLNMTISQDIANLQVQDVRNQWSLLVTLFTRLAKHAQQTRESFLLQFTWILQEFIRPDVSFSDSERDFIIRLLIPKAVEIDHTSDLLGIVSQTFSDVSLDYAAEQLGSNSHLFLLSNDRDRQRYLQQFRRELSLKVVKFARLALRRHEEFLQRNKGRQTVYISILNQSSPANLTSLLG